MKSWFVRPAVGRLEGAVTVPGDKSISHRALMFNALAGRNPETEVTGLLRSEDVMSTKAAVEATLLGGASGEVACDCGNSGTTIRLMMGILAGRPGRTVLTGDASLRRRPMERVAKPLRAMGASIATAEGKPPVTVEGRALAGREITIGVASAQVKSAILLAGLHASGRTVVRMPAASRDHTERMLRHFGVEVGVAPDGCEVSIEGGQRLHPASIDVPGDISSAAFPLVAAMLIPRSLVTLRNVGVNILRTGILDAFALAGARIEVIGTRMIAGEPRAEIVVTGDRYGAFEVGGETIPRLIDEIPVMALAAALADGDESVVRDAQELRVKETDRIAAVVEEFAAIGLKATPTEDGLIIPGRQKVNGGTVRSHGDHRIAMTGAVAGLVSASGVLVEDVACVETSFPGFVELFTRLGADIEEKEE